MTITATIVQQTTQANGDISLLIRLDDTIDDGIGNVQEFIPRVVPGGTDVNAFADALAINKEAEKKEIEQVMNLELVREGKNPETEVSFVRNGEANWQIFLIRSVSNQRPDTAPPFAHIMTVLSNNEIRDALNFNGERSFGINDVTNWKGDIQSLANALTTYQTEHTDNPDFFFEGYPES